jgi:hypothetical protein
VFSALFSSHLFACNNLCHHFPTPPVFPTGQPCTLGRSLVSATVLFGCIPKFSSALWPKNLFGLYDGTLGLLFVLTGIGVHILLITSTPNKSLLNLL